MRAFLLLVFLIILASVASADEINYFYDDIGRLSRVVKGAEGLSYQYDEVGNLLSIGRATISANPPVLNSVIPDVLFIGSTTSVVITGQNLFTTRTVTSDNTSVTIKTRSITDTEIKADITVSPDALNGSIVTFTVTTLFGSANIQVTLTSSKLTFSPGQLALTPGSSGDITASIIPSIGRSVTIPINNSRPSVVSAPQFVTIPSSGETNFTVNAISEGISTINSGPKTVVFVTEAFTPEPGEDVVVKTNPVSVYIGSPTSGETATSSLPVSVYVDAASAEDATMSTLPISVNIEPEPIVDAATASLPVSVYIDAPTAANTVRSSLPVSVYIDAPLGNSTIDSLPVSIKLAQCPNPVKIAGATPAYYSTLQAAYDAAVDGDIIQVTGLIFTEDLNINVEKSVRLKGGYDCYYTTVIGKTTLKGKLKVTKDNNGTMKIENFKFKN